MELSEIRCRAAFALHSGGRPLPEPRDHCPIPQLGSALALCDLPRRLPKPGLRGSFSSPQGAASAGGLLHACLLSVGSQTFQPGPASLPSPTWPFPCIPAWMDCTLVLLGVAQGQQHGHHPRACQKGRPLGRTPNPLSSHLRLNRIPRRSDIR